MTNRFVPYQVQGDDGKAGPYISDQGFDSTINKSFRVPSDITDDGVIDTILECMGLERRTELAPCPESANLKPRTLRFIRSNKNSFSLMLPNRFNVLTAANCVKEAFKDTKFPILCIELIGEHNLNMIEELSPPDKGAPTYGAYIAPNAELGRSVLWYTDVMKEYKTDAGKTVLRPFKSQTDTKDDFYSEISDAFSDCVGSLTTISCAGTTTAEYRHYIPTFLTKSPQDVDVNQVITVPVADSAVAKILECGKAIAKETSVICIEYQGETNKKIHKLIA